jgi:Domain of unknown function (DUF4430)
LALISVALAGCSSTLRVPGSPGRATVWVTRDRGAQVLHVVMVPSGVTAMQALERVAKVKTRYGGRFVQAVDGVEGSLSAGRDWFYFVNGIEADRSAAEYTLRPGDIEWWDYRSWSGAPEYSVVAGAFPEPLIHGYDGKTHPTVVRYFARREAGLARSLGRLVRARSVRPESVSVPQGSNAVFLAPGTRLSASNHDRPYGPVTFEIGTHTAREILSDPAAVRFRFVVTP